MPTLKRRRKIAAAAPPVLDPADRLSRLPDEIQAQILSFLPAQEAVRTCVLARTWRHIWKLTRRLLITGGTVQEVREFVDHLLGLRLHELECAPLDECEIVFPMYANHDTRSTVVNRWIRRCLECQVQALRVEEEGQAYLVMSDRHRLISRHLTRLELRGVGFQCSDLSLDGCPALEHLEITECCLGGVRKIMSPSVKRLAITGCQSNADTQLISAPCLVSLWLEVGAFRAPLLDSMPELVEAHVRIDSYWDNSCSHEP